MTKCISRRSVLRGTIGGAAISVALPFLDCFLNSHGTALAATGKPLPTLFGTWLQHLGFTPGFWEPNKVGTDFTLGSDIKVLEPIKHKMNIFSGLKCFSTGTIAVHTGGMMVGINGGFALPGQPLAQSLDSIIGDNIGTRTRFRSLEVTCDGTPDSYSRRPGNVVNPTEISPLQLYARIFGPDFVDPNAADFKPDPAVMVRKSALSAIGEQRTELMRRVGVADRARLDEYFTSLRSVENQLDLMLTKPEPMVSCSRPAAVDATAGSSLVDDAMARHELFIQLLGHAMACDQTNVFNVCNAIGGREARRAGSTNTFHTYTHEEGTDEHGYQANAGWFMRKSAEALFRMATIFDGIREGDRTLLDRMVVMYTTDHGDAKLHRSENVPMFTFGSGNGRLKTGIHVSAGGDTMARLGLTLQQAMGVSVSAWGTEGNMTSKPFTEVMA